MIPMAPGTWHTAIGQGIPVPLDFGQPVAEIGSAGIAVAAGVVAGVAIAVVVREAWRVRARRPVAAPDITLDWRDIAAVVIPPPPVPHPDRPELRRVAHALGSALLGIGIAFGLGALVAHLAHALPLRELGTHPRLLPAAGAALGGLALITLGRPGHGSVRRAPGSPVQEKAVPAEASHDTAPWQDAA